MVQYYTSYIDTTFSFCFQPVLACVFTGCSESTSPDALVQYHCREDLTSEELFKNPTVLVAETFLRSAFTALLVALLPPGNWRQQTKVFSAAHSTNCAPTTQLQLCSTHLTTLKLKPWWHVNFCAFCKLLWHALFVHNNTIFHSASY